MFGATESSTVTVDVSLMPIPFFFQPNSWTFSADAKSFTISGDAIAFGAGGIINNANTGQTIIIGNAINDGFLSPVEVEQLGNSTLVLAGVNGYSGGTLISAGTVQVTNANSLGIGTVTLDGGTLQMQWPTISSVAFANNFAVNAAGGTVDAAGAQVNLQGVIADGIGAGVLRLTDSIGGGSVQLSGVNTYSGGTLVSGTTVIVSNNSSVGTGTVTLDTGLFQADNVSGDLTFANNFKINNTSSGSAIDANGVTLTIAGNISDGNGSGKLTVLDSFGGGKVVLLGTNTYTGGTTICDCGALQLGDATHTASLVGAVTNFGTLAVVNANTSGITSITNDLEAFTPGLTTFFDGTSASTVKIVNQHGGETDFVGSATAANATIVNSLGGLTTFNATATAGNANISNTSGGQVLFFDGSTAGNAIRLGARCAGEDADQGRCRAQRSAR
jgi:autotransporter-associated beta strand protein